MIVISDSPKTAMNQPLLASQPSPPPYVSAPPNPVIAIQESSYKESRSSANRRFIKAFVVALFIWILTWAMCRSLYSLGDGRWGVITEPRPTDGEVIQCDLPWSTPVLRPPIIPSPVLHRGDPKLSTPVTLAPYSSNLTLHLPLSSHLLYFLARGSHSQGVLRLVASEDLVGHDYAQVDVDVRYWKFDHRSRATLCLLKKDEGAHGLGIFTAAQQWPTIPAKERLHFTVTVRLPASEKSLLTLRALDSNLPLFRHEILDLENKVSFESLTLRGTNAGIRSDSVSVHHAEFETTNGPITGSFTATEKLVLTTSNGAIDVRVDLSNNKDTHVASDLLLKTNNARIISTILLREHNSTTGGAFTVTSKTSNARVEHTFPTAPSYSSLNLNSQTSNAGTSVQLHPSYEGSFHLRSSNAGPPRVIGADEPERDPSGDRRRRRVEMTRVVKNFVEGWIRWEEKETQERDMMELGRVVVVTSNGKNVLKLS